MTYVPNCPAGHPMSARITREVVGAVCSGLPGRCMRCSGRIAARHGFYRCHECDVGCCMQCYRELAAVSYNPSYGVAESAVLAGLGDIVLTGPCVTVTHVILIVSTMEPNAEFRQVLKIPNDCGLYSCCTIETTPFYPRECIVGGRLHRSEYFFQRARNGTVMLVAMRAVEGNAVPTAISPLQCMFLFSPFPRLASLKWDGATFQEAIRQSENSGPYGTTTAIKALVADRRRLNSANFPDEISRAKLLVRLRRAWLKAPICSSIAIITYQRYFELMHRCPTPVHGVCDDGSGSVPGWEDEAVNEMLRWVPLMANRTTPSYLVKTLTTCKWILQEDLCVSPRHGHVDGLVGSGAEGAHEREGELTDSDDTESSGEGTEVGAPDPCVQDSDSPTDDGFVGIEDRAITAKENIERSTRSPDRVTDNFALQIGSAQVNMLCWDSLSQCCSPTVWK